MADANVVLRITSDVGNAITGLNSFISMVGSAISAVEDFAKTNDRFVMSMQRATIDIKEADEATSGLIDTTELYAQQNRLAMAGLRPTSKQYRAIAAAAAEMGKTHGDATSNFKQLVQAITRGSSTALTRYGIVLKENTDKTITQKEALKALEKKYGDTVVKVETLSESMFVLNNNIDTTTGLLWKAITASTSMSGLFTDLNEGLADLNRQLELGFGVWEVWQSKMDVVYKGLGNILIRMGQVAEKLPFLNAVFGRGMQVAGAEISRGAGASAAEHERKRKQREEGKQAAQRTADLWKEMGFLGKTGPKKPRGKGKKKETPEERAERELADLIGERTETDRFESAGFGTDTFLGEMGDPLFAAREDRALAEEKLAAEEERLRRSAAVRAEVAASEEAFREQYHQNQLDRWNANIEMSQSWSEAWTNSMDLVDAKSATIESVWDGLRQATTKLVTSIVKNGKITVKAMAETIQGIALNKGIEAQVNALMAFAQAAMEAATSYGASPRVGQFLQAGAQFQITAAVAFAVAGASGRAARAGGRGGGGADEQGKQVSGGEFSSSYRGSNGQSGKIVVELRGDADQFFEAMVTQNDTRKQNKQKHMVTDE